MAMQVGGADEGGGEMVDINTTPLIDVMLVLLIMFIITIPIQTHAVKLDLPQNPNTPPPDVKPDFNTVEVDFLNQIYWNKTPVTLAQLSSDLKSAANMRPEPETRLHPDGQAKYAVVDQVMASAQQAGVKKLGFVANEQYANQ